MKNKDNTSSAQRADLKGSRRTFLRCSALPFFKPLYTTLGIIPTMVWAQENNPQKEILPTTKALSDAAIDTTGVDVENIALLPEPKAQFMHVAPILCDKTNIRPQLLRQAFEALGKNDPQFNEALQMLFKFVTAEKITNAQDLMAHQAFNDQPQAQQAAQQILTALYTGRLGQGAQSQLVGYEHALMFRPTADVITIPSYSGGKVEFWIDTPLTVK